MFDADSLWKPDAIQQFSSCYCKSSVLSVDIYWDADCNLIIIKCVYLQSSASVDDNSVLYSSVIFNKAVSVVFECSECVTQSVCPIQKGNLFVNYHTFFAFPLCDKTYTLMIVKQTWDSYRWSCLFTEFIISGSRGSCDLQLCEETSQGCEFMTYTPCSFLIKLWATESKSL